MLSVFDGLRDVTTLSVFVRLACALICGGIGAGARTALAQAGIELYPGVSGDALAAVQQLAAGNLAFDPDTTCNHHHEEGHTCGEHDCGEHTCGGHHSGECR